MKEGATHEECMMHKAASTPPRPCNVSHENCCHEKNHRAARLGASFSSTQCPGADWAPIAHPSPFNKKLNIYPLFTTEIANSDIRYAWPARLYIGELVTMSSLFHKHSRALSTNRVQNHTHKSLALPAKAGACLSQHPTNYTPSTFLKL